MWEAVSFLVILATAIGLVCELFLLLLVFGWLVRLFGWLIKKVFSPFRKEK